MQKRRMYNPFEQDALEAHSSVTSRRNLLGLRGAMMSGGKKSLDTTGMTLITIESNSTYMDFGIYSAALATGSTGCTIYWDAETNPDDKTEYTGDLLEPSHTYTKDGRHVIAISDDIKNIYMVSGSSASNYYANRIASVLKGLRTGDKVVSLPTVASSAKPDGIYGVKIIESYDLNNVSGIVRPFFGCGQFGDRKNTTCKTLACNNVTNISSYGCESAHALEDIYCNSLTGINNMSRIGAYRHVNLHFDSTCSVISSRVSLFSIKSSNITFLCSDGRIEWNGTEWETILT